MRRFKYIHKLTKKELDELYQLVQSEDMKYLGNGEKWTKDKLNNIIIFSKKDYNNKYKSSNYIFTVLFINNKLIGLGYIHPGLNKYTNYLQIAILIKSTEQGKGYSKLLINKLIKLNKKYFNKKLISLVKKNNTKSNYSFKKYLKIDEITINKKDYNVYDLNTLSK